MRLRPQCHVCTNLLSPPVLLLLSLFCRYGFVASPVGHGLDTHRTWEALALGCIVLVEASAIDALFTRHQLPVHPLPTLEAWRGLDVGALEGLRTSLGPWTRPAHLVPRLSVAYWTGREPPFPARADD